MAARVTGFLDFLPFSFWFVAWRFSLNRSFSSLDFGHQIKGWVMELCPLTPTLTVITDQEGRKETGRVESLANQLTLNEMPLVKPVNFDL